MWITYIDHSSEKVWGISFFLVQTTIVDIYRGRFLNDSEESETKSTFKRFFNDNENFQL